MSQTPRCHYTGAPAYADISGGLINAGYGSRHDTTRFVFLKVRPADLPDGAWLSDEILDAWIAEGRIAPYEDHRGLHALSPDLLRAVFAAHRTWAVDRIQELADGKAPAKRVLRMFLGGDRNEEPDPVRLALVAAAAEAIGGRPVTLEQLLLPWETRRKDLNELAAALTPDAAGEEKGDDNKATEAGRRFAKRYARTMAALAGGDVAGNNLERDLAASALIRRLVLDDGFAVRLYRALCNTKWRKREASASVEPWTCTWRRAGSIIAHLRGRGGYLDWYCAGGEATVADDVRKCLETLGWELVHAEPPNDDLPR